MTPQSSLAGSVEGRELVITRLFHAPRKLVFQAWTDPARVQKWMGPRGFMAHHVEYDLRPGGAWRLCLRPDGGGRDLWQSGVYRRIVEPSLLEFTFHWDADESRADHETLVTVTFEDRTGGTWMTFRQSVFESVELRDGHNGGWSSSFDRLEESLAQEREILTK